MISHYCKRTVRTHCFTYSGYQWEIKYFVTDKNISWWSPKFCFPKAGYYRLFQFFYSDWSVNSYICSDVLQYNLTIYKLFLTDCAICIPLNFGLNWMRMHHKLSSLSEAMNWLIHMSFREFQQRDPYLVISITIFEYHTIYHINVFESTHSWWHPFSTV